MRKAVILFVSILFFACTESGDNNDCFPFISVNETINLDLPQFIDLQVPGGWAYTVGGHQGLIIYNINGVQFKAYDRLCPGQNISSCSQMIVDSNLRILCQCDDSEFNILNGQPLTPGVECFAKEYLVENLNGTILRVTNF
jgi:nitrite reductase/ring-hydroxylating ferredoxin subunit